MISELLYVGFAVTDVDHTRRVLWDFLRLPSERMEADPFLGTTRGARIAFPNRCWLYLMESQDPGSRVFQHVREKGPGLERIALRTDDIEADVERLRANGVPAEQLNLAETPLGVRLVVPPERLSGTTVELLQVRAGAWEPCAPDSTSGVLGLQHIGIATNNLENALANMQKLLDLPSRQLRTNQHGGQQKDVILLPGNDRLWLHMVQSWEPGSRVATFLKEHGEGLDHICIEVEDIRKPCIRIIELGIPFVNHKIHTDRPDGFEAFLSPEYTTGIALELIEPFPFSRGYRERR